MANEISVTGNKKLKTLYKEFNKNFHYISLCVFPLSEKGKSSQSPHNSEMRISEVRTKTNPGDISIHGRTHAGNLEEEFEKFFWALLAGVLQRFRWRILLHHWCFR